LHAPRTTGAIAPRSRRIWSVHRLPRQSKACSGEATTLGQTLRSCAHASCDANGHAQACATLKVSATSESQLEDLHATALRRRTSDAGSALAARAGQPLARLPTRKRACQDRSIEVEVSSGQGKWAASCAPSTRSSPLQSTPLRRHMRGAALHPDAPENQANSSDCQREFEQKPPACRDGDTSREDTARKPRVGDDRDVPRSN
jgi:hypothetical protein